MTSQQKGEVAQLKVQVRAVEKGFIVARPTVDCRYDLIIDTGKKLLRAQVKYADGKSSHAAGAVLLGLRRWAGNDSSRWRVYTGMEVDLLLVYVAKVNKVVALSPSDFSGRSSLCLRYTPPKIKQPSVRLVDDFVW